MCFFINRFAQEIPYAVLLNHVTHSAMYGLKLAQDQIVVRSTAKVVLEAPNTTNRVL